ncbi:hypothetical protein TNCV_4112451 [Trichonephila clavipes]|nr:hypothetical protein TNCV_4112451 [Trichonephila clavipes]
MFYRWAHLVYDQVSRRRGAPHVLSLGASSLRSSVKICYNNGHCEDNPCKHRRRYWSYSAMSPFGVRSGDVCSGDGEGVGLFERIIKPCSLNSKIESTRINCSSYTRALLATDDVILNHGQATWTTPELAPRLLTTTPTGGLLSSRHN